MSQLNILIVDDNKDLADGLGIVLGSEGYQTTLTYNGDDCIKAFNAGHFDVVFIDVKLPDMSGVDVFHEIHMKDPKVKVIMMTGYRVEQLLTGVIDDVDIEILHKPFELERVLEVLNNIRQESIILIADDNPDISHNLSTYLTNHGIKTMLARNGEEAVNGILSNPIEVLVLDLRMPIMCGLEVYLELKQRDRAVKTIFVTGYAKEETETIDILKSTSATGCLFKPFRPEDMIHAIERIMEP